MDKREFIKAYSNCETEQERKKLIGNYHKKNKKEIYIIGGREAYEIAKQMPHLKEGVDFDLIKQKDLSKKKWYPPENEVWYPPETEKFVLYF